jgi:hypothetical protein
MLHEFVTLLNQMRRSHIMNLLSIIINHSHLSLVWNEWRGVELTSFGISINIARKSALFIRMCAKHDA